MFSPAIVESLFAQLAAKPDAVPTDAAGWAKEVLRQLIIARQNEPESELGRATSQTLEALSTTLGACLSAWGSRTGEMATAIDALLDCLANIDDPLVRRLGTTEAQMVTSGVGMLRTMFKGGSANAEAQQ